MSESINMGASVSVKVFENVTWQSVLIYVLFVILFLYILYLIAKGGKNNGQTSTC